MSKRKTFNVLSIDGGGIRGIIPALVLDSIEQKTGMSTAQNFDLIAGTSTGAILALGLSKNGGGGNQEQYSAEALADIYASRGREIFDRSFWKGVSSVGGLADEKYSHEGLENVLNEYFGDTTLSQTHCTTRTLVACYDIGARQPLFLKSWRDIYASVRMADAARATSAAPTYFEPHQICIGSEMRTLIDGGIFVNTPVVSAYAEARRIISEEKTFEHLTDSDIFVVSIGTGKLTREIQYEEAKGWGKVEWLLPALSCIFDGISDAADYHMKRFLGEENAENYIRLQSALGDADDDMDNASRGNIRNLRAVADELIDSDEFTEVHNRLMESKGTADNPT